MDKTEAIEILNVIYIRFMRLLFSYQTFEYIFYSPDIAYDYPNLCWCMQVSFATDAYVTISGIIRDGTFSFSCLAKKNENIRKKYNQTLQKMEQIVPDINTFRNQMFCHLVKRQTDNAICAINKNFVWLINCIKEFHHYCCEAYAIADSELDGYDSDTFLALNRELQEFSQLLTNGSADIFHDMLAEIESGATFEEAKEIRRKRIKSEAL